MNAPANMDKRVRTKEAAAISGLDVRTLQEKAAAGEIPGARKVFGRWTFDPILLAKLGRTPCPKSRNSRGGATGAGRSSTIGSRSKATNIAKAYELVLSQTRSGA